MKAGPRLRPGLTFLPASALKLKGRQKIVFRDAQEFRSPFGFEAPTHFTPTPSPPEAETLEQIPPRSFGVCLRAELPAGEQPLAQRQPGFPDFRGDGRLPPNRTPDEPANPDGF